MTLDAKFRGAMGLAMKAGKCQAGDFVCEKLVRAGKAKLVLLDSAASDATKQRYRGMCSRAGIEALETDDMGVTIGKPGRMIAVVTDDNFVRMIKASYDAAYTQKDTGVE